MGEKMSEEKTVAVGLRLPESLMARIDAYAEKRTRALDGLTTVSRSDVVRAALLRGLSLLEAEENKP